MNPVIYNVALDIYSNEVKLLEGQKQGDSKSRFIRAKLIDRTGQVYQLDNTMTATARIAKPDHKISLPPCEIDPAVNTLTFELTQQALAAVGTARGEVTLFDGSGTRILSSQIFQFEIEAVPGITLESTNEFDSITQVISQAVDAQAQLDEKIAASEAATSGATEAAGAASTAAGTATSAAGTANSAASSANAAASNATSAAGAANSAAQSATNAASSATSAAQAANNAASNVQDILNGATATQSSNGLMSSADKTKLDGIAAITSAEIDATAV